MHNVVEKSYFSSFLIIDSQDGTWYPKEKIRQAKKKLHGYNPARVMCVDLKQGHEKTQEYSALRAILMGDKKYNERAKVRGQRLFLSCIYHRMYSYHCYSHIFTHLVSLCALLKLDFLHFSLISKLENCLCSNYCLLYSLSP